MNCYFCDKKLKQGDLYMKLTWGINDDSKVNEALVCDKCDTIFSEILFNLVKWRRDK